jgi:hypothetical protein
MNENAINEMMDEVVSVDETAMLPAITEQASSTNTVMKIVKPIAIVGAAGAVVHFTIGKKIRKGIRNWFKGLVKEVMMDELTVNKQPQTPIVDAEEVKETK